MLYFNNERSVLEEQRHGATRCLGSDCRGREQEPELSLSVRRQGMGRRMFVLKHILPVLKWLKYGCLIGGTGQESGCAFLEPNDH